ncbi:unnamed protein product [Cuscuta epithymum]|nr:unnamed protein product [Cuscuta epithymum]
MQVGASLVPQKGNCKPEDLGAVQITIGAFLFPLLKLKVKSFFSTWMDHSKLRTSQTKDNFSRLISLDEEKVSWLCNSLLLILSGTKLLGHSPSLRRLTNFISPWSKINLESFCVWLIWAVGDKQLLSFL